MASVSLARQYRPQRFDEVYGQRHVTRTLQNAIRLGRTAQAYLFCGPRGVGKTTVARILAKALNCAQGPTPEPCGECENCQRVVSGGSLCVIEIDAASNNKIEHIRSLREDVQFAPVDGRYKVYILDEAHQITPQAFEAFLKTLEEPPAHVVFVLATTEPERIPATILSRCQRFDFRRVGIDDIANRLQEVASDAGFEVDPAAVFKVAEAADGGLRDALSILDQVIAYAGAKVTAADVDAVLGLLDLESRFRFGEALAARDVSGLLGWLAGHLDAGRDPRTVIEDALAHLRLVLLAKLGTAPEALRALTDEQRQRVGDLAERFDAPRLMAAMEHLAACSKALRYHPQPRIVVEVALLELACDLVPTPGAPARPTERPTTAPPARPRAAAPAAAAPPPPLAEVRPPAEGQSPAPPPAEPPPAAAPAPALAEVSAPVETLDVATVQSRLGAVLDHVGQRLMPLTAHLVHAFVLRVEGDLVVLGFRGWEASLDRCSQPGRREVIEDALRAVLGRPVTWRGELVDEVAEAAVAPDLDTAVNLALETFPGSRELDP